MAFENADQAATALAEAMNAPDSPAQHEYAGGEPTGDPNQFAVTPSTTQGDQGDQGTQAQPTQSVAPAEPFTPSKDIDLSGLNEEQLAYVQAREKEMQAAFTQKTQELAVARQEAEQAIQFVNELNTNPYFAAEVVNELSQQLQLAGMSPQQADQVALGQAQQMATGQPIGEDYGDPNDYEEFGDDPYLREIEDLRQQQAQIAQYLSRQEESQRIAGLEAQLNNMVAAVRNDHPDWSDNDLSRVINMAYAYNGDIQRAAMDYAQVQQDAITSWTERKGSVNAPAVIEGSGHAQSAPESFESLDDPRLEAAAMRRLNEALGG